MKCLTIIFSIILLAKIALNQNFKYTAQLNSTFKISFNQINFLSSYHTNSKLNCMAKCNQNDSCLSLIYTYSSSNCVLYRRRPNISMDVVSQIGTNYYLKNGKRIFI